MNAKNILISIDQLFNTLAGGNPDVTISGHISVMATLDKRWINVKKMIDLTFAPIELNHCEDSFLADNDFDTTDNIITTSIVAIIGCALLFIPIRILGVINGFKHSISRRNS
jgi:hypothetical protein